MGLPPARTTRPYLHTGGPPGPKERPIGRKDGGLPWGTHTQDRDPGGPKYEITQEDPGGPKYEPAPGFGGGGSWVWGGLLGQGNPAAEVLVPPIKGNTERAHLLSPLWIWEGAGASRPPRSSYLALASRRIAARIMFPRFIRTIPALREA